MGPVGEDPRWNVFYTVSSISSHLSLIAILTTDIMTQFAEYLQNTFPEV
jgi:hypothetical protein